MEPKQKGSFEQENRICKPSILWLPAVTLPETNTPENGWLEYDRFLLGPRLFSGAMLGLGSVSNTQKSTLIRSGDPMVGYWLRIDCLVEPILQGGPLPVISRVITPLVGVITPVTSL